MKLDAEKYRINIPLIKLLLERKEPHEIVPYIGAIAVATDVPILVVCHYIGEIYGFSGELLALIERLKDFYQVDGVTSDVD